MGWAIERADCLFSGGERVVLNRVLLLSADAGELYARLSLRTPELFFAADLAYACATPQARADLENAGLTTGVVPDDRALQAATMARTKAACVRLGLPVGGKKADIEARLFGKRWCDEEVVMPLHRSLLWRCGRVGGFDRSQAPVDRIAGTKWAEYEPTGGTDFFGNRTALLAYERARSDAWDPGEALATARRGAPAFGPSNFRLAVDRLAREGAKAAEWTGIAGCEVPLVRALESEGAKAEALAVCRSGSPDPEIGLALTRTGRRLARSLKEPWPPAAPLSEATPRSLRLPRAPEFVVNGRPAWRAIGGDPEPTTVEQAAIGTVLAAGRNAVHAENWLWTGVFALVFRSAYFAPVPGMLPTRHRAGPIDLGTPTFYEKRRALADNLMGKLEREGLLPFVAEWSGERLDGLFHAESVVEHAGPLPGAFLANVMRPLLLLGWSAARGLPDVLVAPGEAITLAGAFPAKLPKAAFFAEVKGPGDTLRDGQRLWHARLVDAGILVELWHISE